MPFTADCGLNWLIIVVVPEADFMEHIQKQLRHNAFHDALTGLPNRAFFMESLKHTLQRAKRQKNSSLR
jgi:GGDEF domain-containing protein